MTIDMKGNLGAMDLPTLIQFVAQEGSVTSIHLKSADGHVGELYIDNEELYHAELHGPNGEQKLVGEEVVYELLSWDTGTFEVEQNVQPPAVSIHAKWSFLLMEGVRQLDEKHRIDEDDNDEELLSELLADMSSEDVAKIKDLVKINKEIDMANVQQTLDAIMGINGSIAAALVDWESGLTLGTVGSGLNIDLAAAGNTNVVRSKQAVMKDLGLKGNIEDILITLTEQYHLIRILHDTGSHLFLYVALDRTHANLGMARHKLAAIEADLEI